MNWFIMSFRSYGRRSRLSPSSAARTDPPAPPACCCRAAPVTSRPPPSQDHHLVERSLPTGSQVISVSDSSAEAARRVRTDQITRARNWGSRNCPSAIISYALAAAWDDGPSSSSTGACPTEPPVGAWLCVDEIRQSYPSGVMLRQASGSPVWVVTKRSPTWVVSSRPGDAPLLTVLKAA